MHFLIEKLNEIDSNMRLEENSNALLRYSQLIDDLNRIVEDFEEEYNSVFS